MTGGLQSRFRLDEHVAVVTGAGRGIGAEVACTLAEAGADVVIAARSGEQLEQVAERVRALGRRAVTVSADLSDVERVAGLAEAAMAEFGRLDVVVNNVGGAMPQAFLDTDVTALEAAFHFNVSTAHALSRAAVPLMLRGPRQAQRSIVSISSVLGRAAGRGYLAYGTAKAALAHWTRLAAQDLSPHVRVNGLFLGPIMTSALDMVAAIPELMQQMEHDIPLGRVGTVQDVASAALYLASPAGAYLTGKLIEIDGGLQQGTLDLGLPDLEPQG